MDEFNDCGQGNVMDSTITIGPSPEKDQQWSQAFTATIDNVISQLVH